MKTYKVCVVGGSCGHRMLLVADHLADLLKAGGYPCRVTHHSIWENYSTPPQADLVLQLLPAYTPDESACPVLNIRPLLIDQDQPETIARILEQVNALISKDEPTFSTAGEQPYPFQSNRR